MKIIHEYDTENLKDQIIHNHHHNAEKYFCCLAEIKRYVRTIWKWEDMTDEARDKVNQIYEMICHNTEELDI
jgi:hypothetical protein